MIAPVGILTGDNHEAADIPVRLPSGRVLLIFRQDPNGLAGHHIGNAGRIMATWSDDDGETWSAPTLVYDDAYDDRNCCVGVFGSRVLLMFSLFNATNSTRVGERLMYSDDGGETWSTPAAIDLAGMSIAFGPIRRLGNYAYTVSAYSSTDTSPQWQVKLMYSTDGINWPTNQRITVVGAGYESRMFGEPSFLELSNGTIICILREHASPYRYWRTVSTNGGTTWSAPAVVNHGESYALNSRPHLFAHGGYVYLTYGDRRGITLGQAANADCRIWIARVPEADAATGSFVTWDSFPRQLAANDYQYPAAVRNFYGYPFTVEMDDRIDAYYIENWNKAADKEEAEYYRFTMPGLVPDAAPLGFDFALTLTDIFATSGTVAASAGATIAADVIPAPAALGFDFVLALSKPKHRRPQRATIETHRPIGTITTQRPRSN